MRDEPAIAAAIRANNVGALVRAGGSAAEGAAIMRATCSGRLCALIPRAGTEEFRVMPEGTVVIYGQTPPGSDYSGDRVFVNTVDMADLTPRPDMRPYQNDGFPDALGATALPPPTR